MVAGRRVILGQRLAAPALMVALVLASALTSCRVIWPWDDSDCEPEAYRIHIDSLRFAPAEPSAGDTLYVRFWGTVGTSTCYGFTHFETARDSFEVHVTAWGEHTCELACGAMMIFLQGEELPVFPIHEGDLTVVVHQPDGAVLVDTVAVAAARSGRET